LRLVNLGPGPPRPSAIFSAELHPLFSPFRPKSALDGWDGREGPGPRCSAPLRTWLGRAMEVPRRANFRAATTYPNNIKPPPRVDLGRGNRVRPGAGRRGHWASVTRARKPARLHFLPFPTAGPPYDPLWSLPRPGPILPAARPYNEMRPIVRRSIFPPLARGEAAPGRDESRPDLRAPGEIFPEILLALLSPSRGRWPRGNPRGPASTELLRWFSSDPQRRQYRGSKPIPARPTKIRYFPGPLPACTSRKTTMRMELRAIAGHPRRQTIARPHLPPLQLLPGSRQPPSPTTIFSNGPARVPGEVIEHSPRCT